MGSPIPLVLVLALSLAQRAPAAPVTVTRETVQMGTYARFSVVARDRPSGLELAGVAIDAVETAEQVLSTFRPSTAVSAINRAPVGEPVAVSPLFLSLVGPAYGIATETSFLFDPGIGALTGVWGINGSARLPGPHEVEEARQATGAGAFLLDADRGTVCRLHPGARLDTGGFGKGAGLDLAADALRSRGVETAVLDLGGQVLVVGGPIEVSIADPRDRGRVVAVLAVRDASVATSGNSERGAIVGTRRVGHIVDPRTGAPVAFDGSVTVVAPTGLEADALSKPLFVLGPGAGLEPLRGRAGVEALFLTPVGGGRLRLDASPGMRALVVATAPEVIWREPEGAASGHSGRAPTIRSGSFRIPRASDVPPLRDTALPR